MATGLPIYPLRGNSHLESEQAVQRWTRSTQVAVRTVFKCALATLCLICACSYAAQPPIISEVNIFPSDTPLTTELVTLAITANSPDSLPLKVVWNFGDGTERGSDLYVTHTFTAPGDYAVTVTVSDGVNAPVMKVSHLLAIAPPPEGSSPGANQGEVETNPDNGLSSAVISSAAGVVELQITTAAIGKTVIATDFGDGGRIAHGASPRHAYASPGIYIATSNLTDDSGSALGTVRKTLVISGQNLSEAAPTLTPTPPSSHALNVTAFASKFNLKSLSELDVVKLTFSVELPGGLELRSGHAITLSVGNVVETVLLNRKGSGQGSKRYKRVKIAWPTAAKASVTSVGQFATVSVQMASADLRTAGFDTEGISNLPKRMQPTIQIGMFLEGFAWSVEAPVALKISPKVIVATLGSN
jgi:PKD repeat protein